MLEELNSVLATVAIDGKVISFLRLKLEQEFNHHHTFEIVLNHQVLEDKWMMNPAQILSLVNSNVAIHFIHKMANVESFFNGIVRNVSFVGNNGVHNQISISGNSPTILLDDKNTMNSFVDKTIKDIVDESVAKSGNGVEVNAKPLFTSSLKYLCQYDETCFGFLNRLSWLYGEWFYYDGSKTLFGKPEDSDTVELTYNVNLSEMNFSANLVPSKIAKCAYLPHDSSEIFYSSTDEDVDVVGYAKTILGISSSVYTSDSIVPLEAPISSKSDLETLVKVEKARAVAQMLVLSGKSLTCGVGIGKKIHVKLPPSMDVPIKDIDTFRVRKVIHEMNGKGEYCNRFEAFVSDVEYIPMEPAQSQKASPQIATVVDNEDSKGRIKVQFQWQKMIGKQTNWIKVQTPDGGSSSKGVRGSIFVPEIGDVVMVGFEYGSPNFPYVTGSVFPESIGTGGGKGNNSKSVTTRSGSALKLDDSSGSVKLQDPGKSSLDMDGNGKTKIDSSEQIALTCGSSSIELNMDGKILINGKELNVQAENKIDETTKTHTLTGTDAVKIKSDTLIEQKAPKVATEASNQVSVIGKNSVDLEGEMANIKGASAINLN